MLPFFRKFLINSIFISSFFSPVYSQLVTYNPVFPKETDSVTITFNSAEGSAGLANYSGDIYAHTGVITNLSASNSDWKYVKTSWGQNTPDTKLTKIGNNLYQFKIKPNIKSYYAVPQGETILKIALVFRSDVAVGGSFLEGKTTDGGDIFIGVFDNGLNLQLNKPNSGYLLSQIGDTIPLNLTSINADSVFLFYNNLLINSDSGNNLMDTVFVNAKGKFWIKAVAKNSLNTVMDSFYYFVNSVPDTLAPPIAIKEGINYLDSQSVILELFAPQIDYIYVIGDFNNWQLDTNFAMHITPDKQYYWLKINNLQSSKEYIFQYLINGNIAVGDPYCEKISDPWNDSYIDASTYPNMLQYPKGKTKGVASVLKIDKTDYVWKHNNFQSPENENLVIYELLIRDFVAKHSFKSVIDSLHYLKELGINALELMPVNEFEGNSSWGYNTSFYFAVDKYYGTPNDFKSLIDSCHALGIAVIMDVVYNHVFGTSPYVMMWWDSQFDRPAANNPFYNAVPKHDFNVGYDMNHLSLASKKYISNVLKFWLTEYKVDGFRFDLSKGFTQNNTLGNISAMANYDASRIHILESYADSIWSVNPKAYTILEHFADNSEEKELAARGMMLWSNLNNNYNEGAMGYNTSGKSDFSWISYKKRAWTNSYVVAYMESHDEERAMYKCSQYGNNFDGYNIKNENIYMQRASLNAVFFLTVPGPKMIWQFGELGYDVSIDFNGRTGEKPIRWEYMKDLSRWNNYQIYKALNNLRAEEPKPFLTKDFDLNVASAKKSIILRDSSMNVVIVGNYDVKLDTFLVAFPHNGIWYDFFSGKDIEIKNLKFLFNLDAGEYHLLTDKQKLKPQLSIAPAEIKKDIGNFEGFLDVFPNPSSGDVSFFINTLTDSELSFYDINGRKISSILVAGSGKRIISLNSLNLVLDTGIYFCKMLSGEQVEVRKFIIL